MTVRGSILFALATLLAAAVDAQTTYPLQQQPNTGLSATNYNSRTMGWEFRPSIDGVQVTRLGCLVRDSTYGFNRIVTIFDTTTSSKVAQAAPPDPSPDNQWSFVDLPAPVQLVKDRLYIIAVFGTSAQSPAYHQSEYWCNQGSFPSWFPSGEIVFTRSVYRNSTQDPDIMPTVTWSTTQMHGIPDFGYIKGPTLTTTASLGTQQSLYPAEQGPTGDGAVVGTFTIENNNVLNQDAALTSITILGGGTGDHTTAYTSIELFRDMNGNGLLDIGIDTQIGATESGLTDPGNSMTFDVQPAEQVFPPAPTAGYLRTYMIVVKLAGTAQFDEFFTYVVNDIAVGVDVGKAGVPSLSMAGFRITHTPFFGVDNGPASAPSVYSDGLAHVVMDFTLDYPQGASRTVVSMTFRASGTGDDSLDVTAVELYRDDGSGGFDPANDFLIEAEVAYPADDDYLTFDFPSTPVDEQTFTEGDSRRFFLVYTFTRGITPGATFQAQLTGITEVTVGLTLSPLPLPYAAPAAGVIVENENLDAILIEPLAASVVANNDQGPLNRGLNLLTVDLVSYGADWDVSELHIEASGTGDDSTAFNSVILMEDANGNGLYDGLPQDRVASLTTPSAFPTNDGVFVAPLEPHPTYGMSVPAGVTRRFFVAVKLIGTAMPGETFNASLEAITTSTSNNGTFAPSLVSDALVIDVPTMVVGLGSGSPPSTSREQGPDFTHILAKFRFTVSGAPATLGSIGLSSHGSADLAALLQPGNGIEVWLDNGNGVFDGLLGDTLVWQSGGDPVKTFCDFANFPGGSGPIVIPNGASRDLWIQISVLAAAGGSVPDTFQVAIDSPLDVDGGPGTNVTLAAEAPVSGVLSVVVFSVDAFEPGLAYQEGGENIYIYGSGFSQPVEVTINGVECPGNPVVSADGRQISGLVVPPGAGKELEIRLKTGGLEEKILPMTFNYAGGSQISEFDHTDTCAAAGGGGLPWLAALPALWLLARRRRRQEQA